MVLRLELSETKGRKGTFYISYFSDYSEVSEDKIEGFSSNCAKTLRIALTSSVTPEVSFSFSWIVFYFE